MNKLVLVIGVTILALAGCTDSDERYDAGYGDGYAEGYNTECKIRSTMVGADWDNDDYSRGYNLGRIEGVRVCRSGEEP